MALGSVDSAYLLRRQTRICLWHSGSAFERPQRPNVGLQFLAWCDECKLHLLAKLLDV